MTSTATACDLTRDPCPSCPLPLFFLLERLWTGSEAFKDVRLSSYSRDISFDSFPVRLWDVRDGLLSFVSREGKVMPGRFLDFLSFYRPGDEDEKDKTVD